MSWRMGLEGVGDAPGGMCVVYQKKGAPFEVSKVGLDGIYYTTARKVLLSRLPEMTMSSNRK